MVPRPRQAGAATYSPTAGSHAADGQRKMDTRRTAEEIPRVWLRARRQRSTIQHRAGERRKAGTKLCKTYNARTRDKSNPAPAEAKMNVTNCKSEKRPVLRSSSTDEPDNWPRRCCARYQGLNGDKPEAKSVLRIAKFGPAAEISTLSNFGSDLQP